MPYNPFELSVYVAFDSLLNMEDGIVKQVKNDPTAWITNGETICDTKILKDTIETACNDYGYSDDYYPLLFGFAKSVTHVFYTTPAKGNMIIDDVAAMRMSSPVVSEMHKQQLLFIEQSRDVLTYAKKNNAIIDPATLQNTKRKIHLAQNIFSTSFSTDAMTPREHAVLIDLATRADKVKTPPHPFLIIPYAQVG